MKAADSLKPQASSSRTGKPYAPGIGPHTESQTTTLVFEFLKLPEGSAYRGKVELEVPYERASRSRCDVSLGERPSWEWCVEIKMLRLMGDNGKPNDNILMHILSPYPAHRSALTDCEKLLSSGLAGRKAILIYGYDYPQWPMDPAIEAFEVLAKRAVGLSARHQAAFSGLVHPVHQAGRVFGWELAGSQAAV
jgi:hypothetical protein